VGNPHEDIPNSVWCRRIPLWHGVLAMWSKKHWHRDYFEIINRGSIDRDAVSDWEYKWAGLSFPDGYHPRRILVGGRLDYPP